MFVFKKLYFANHESDKMPSMNNMMINEKASEKLLFESFLTNEEFLDDPLFLLSSGIVTYLKTTSTLKNGEKAGIIWDNLKAGANFKDLSDKNSATLLLKRELYNLNKIIS